MIYNHDQSRAVSTEAVSGIACYVRNDQTNDGLAHFTHVGMVETMKEAERWLQGDAAIFPLLIYPLNVR